MVSLPSRRIRTPNFQISKIFLPVDGTHWSEATPLDDSLKSAGKNWRSSFRSSPDVPLATRS